MINELLWSYVIPLVIIFAGLIFSLKMLFRPQAGVFRGVYFMRPAKKGAVTPFKALMVAMAGTVGTGNIAGVATAITLGGPGALFFIWVMGFFALAIVFVETWSAVKFHRLYRGALVGGPTYYLQNIFPGKSGRFLAKCYAFSLLGAGFGIGSMVQSNSVASVGFHVFQIHPFVTGMLMLVLVAIVVYGGGRRIAAVCSFLVPLMVVVYFTVIAGVLLVNWSELGAVFSLIFDSAFDGHEAVGGFAGASVWAAMHYGLSRGIFASEAGMGSAAIAHASADVSHPGQQAFVAILGTFINIFVVCTLTGMVVILSGLWASGDTGSVLTAKSLHVFIGPIGDWVISASLVLFAISTILSWGYYTQVVIQCFAKEMFVNAYRVFWLLAIFVGSVVSLQVVWEIADFFNGMMLLINLIALPCVFFRYLPQISSDAEV